MFDSGGTEALFLHEQGIPFEVVPGIPAGIGVPATRAFRSPIRAAATSSTFVRGHEAETDAAPRVGLAACRPARRHARLLRRPAADRRDRRRRCSPTAVAGDEAAALIYDGTTPTQETIVGTLATIADAGRSTMARRMLVVGRVVGLREHLRWFDDRPLFGKRILVTRPREQAAELVDLLEERGAEAIRGADDPHRRPRTSEPLDARARRPADFDWIVFSSANAVDAFMQPAARGRRRAGA